MRFELTPRDEKSLPPLPSKCQAVLSVVSPRPVETSPWAVSCRSFSAARALTVKRALTAYSARARKDPGEAFVLEPGTRIVPLCSDGQERMWFETEKGKGGVLLLVPDEENMWLIDGEPEADFFEYLPYSG